MGASSSWLLVLPGDRIPPVVWPLATVGSLTNCAEVESLLVKSGEVRVGWRMSVPLKARPPTVTFSGVMSTVTVVDRWSAGSCPTMLKPKVVPSSGLNAVRKKCVSVLVDGCGLAPPTVGDMGWSAESGIKTGAGELPALAGDASKGMVMAGPAAKATDTATGPLIRSSSNQCPLGKLPDSF